MADGNEGLNAEWDAICAERSYGQTEVLGGCTLRLYWDSVIAELIFKRQYENCEQIFTWRYLQPGDVYFDVGANIGLFSLIAARRVGAEGKVYAFEPVDHCIRRLQENIEINALENVRLVQAALSDEETQSEIFVPHDGCDAWSSLAPPSWGSRIRKQAVSTTTLDSFISRLDGSAPRMIKLDVEGWENRVLEGSRRCLSRHGAPLVQVEFTDENALAAGSSCSELYDSLTGLGFEVCHYDVEANKLIPEGPRPEYPYVNLYATKNVVSDNARLATSKIGE